MEQKLDWEVILDLALKEVASVERSSVGGSKFRSYVGKIASQHGVVFPPEGMHSFSTFLESFPHKLIVQRTPGRDIQIVPIDRPELLVSASSPNAGARIREDFFLALTAIPNPTSPFSYYYFPEKDRVHRLEPGAEVVQSAISLPSTSYEQEISIRRDFVDGGEFSRPEAAALRESLEGTKVLASFTSAIRSHGLAQKWHQYRLQKLAENLKIWADQKAVTWQPSWISGTHERYNTVALSDGGTESPVQVDELLSFFSGKLSPEDISRISVPLDIVLKLLSNK